MKTILTDSEINELDNIEMDDFDYIKQSSVTEFARAIEQAIIQKIGEPYAYCTYKGYLLHAEDPRVNDHSEPTPLYAIPFICAERSESGVKQEDE